MGGQAAGEGGRGGENFHSAQRTLPAEPAESGQCSVSQKGEILARPGFHSPQADIRFSRCYLFLMGLVERSPELEVPDRQGGQGIDKVCM